MSELDGLGYGGKRVVVTGAASGMGEAAARILGELGAEVHAVDLNEPSIPRAGFYPTDLSQPHQVAVTVDKLRAVAPIDFFFSCAGISHTFGAVKCMLVNYVGARQIIEGTLPAMTG